jgi:hypothetical protein
MIGRRVSAWRSGIGRAYGTCVKFEPLSAAMCDALIRFDDGYTCWFSSHELQPADGGGPLPDRRAIQEHARCETLTQLRAIRERLVASWHKRWQGCEHGKAIIGRAIDGAISDLEKER